MTDPIGVAVVGCGYIADSYRKCLPLHKDALRLVGVYDRDPQRLAAFASCWGDLAYASLDALLADPATQIVINATDPHNHPPVTRAALDAGKHVYRKSRWPCRAPKRWSCGPCGFARPASRRGAVQHSRRSAQTLWAAVRAGKIGAPRLVYAELDDGMIHKADYRTGSAAAAVPGRRATSSRSAAPMSTPATC